MDIFITQTAHDSRSPSHDEQTVTFIVSNITRTELNRILLGLYDYNLAAPGRTTTEEFVSLSNEALNEFVQSHPEASTPQPEVKTGPLELEDMYPEE